MFSTLKRRAAAAVSVSVLAAGLMTPASQATAQDKWLGEIVPVGFTFCPRSTTEANGQLLAIAQFSALFSLYGTTYGGDGRTTFALPDLRGRSPVHVGTGPGLQQRTLGQKGGANGPVTLTINNMPSHSHIVNSVNQVGNRANPNNDYPARSPDGGPDFYHDGPATAQMDPGMISSVGGNQPVNTDDPFLTIRYCVVTEGLYPSRN